VLAAQLGQLSTQSALGQPLVARIATYGTRAADTGRLAVQVLPDLGAPIGSGSTAAVRSLRAAIASDAPGDVHIALTSSLPIRDLALSFRVRLSHAAGASIRHYVLALSPPAASTGQRRDGNPRSEFDATYGPVAAGDSLWRILAARGLTHGDVQGLMADIVVMNPAAFVAGDPNRLRVGAHLRLPQTRPQAVVVLPVERHSPAQAAGAQPTSSLLATPVQPQAAPPTATVAPARVIRTPPPPALGYDPETAARLAALSEKFAAIRARYQAQQASRAPVQAHADTRGSNPSGATQAVVRAAPLADRPGIAESVLVPMPSVADIPPARPDLADASRGDWWWLIASCVLGVLTVALLGAYLWRRWRADRETVTWRSTDQELLAEISRKTEKRVQLESEVRRMVADRRNAAPPTAPASAPEATPNADLPTIEDIETQIAYGQYTQAEASLEQVIAATPDNHRAKLRLAEIYYLNERQAEFCELADEIYRKHRADIGDDNWQRVMRMGKVIAPDRAPFSGPVDVAQRSAG